MRNYLSGSKECVMLLLAVLLAGCAVNFNSVDVEQEATPANPAEEGVTLAGGKGTANGSNILVVNFDRSPISTNKDQKSTGEIPIGYNGGTAASGRSGLTDVVSKYAPDLSKKDSENVTTTTQTTNYQNNEDNTVEKEDVSGQVDQGKEEASEDLDYKNKATYTSYGTRNGGRQAWRIPKKGPEFGSQIKVVFSDGHTVIVKDTSHNYRESDGFVFKPGIGPNGEGQDNTGTSHGGVYLHAPYGNNSKQVTFYYNAP
jgi:hypothetical protein